MFGGNGTPQVSLLDSLVGDVHKREGDGLRAHIVGTCRYFAPHSHQSLILTESVGVALVVFVEDRSVAIIVFYRYILMKVRSESSCRESSY